MIRTYTHIVAAFISIFHFNYTVYCTKVHG